MMQVAGERLAQFVDGHELPSVFSYLTLGGAVVTAAKSLKIVPDARGVTTDNHVLALAAPGYRGKGKFQTAIAGE
jgi:hypothetical protein